MSWWKILCLDCGVNTDLLTDNFNRIICRECLNKHEFPEVESIIYAHSDREISKAGEKFLRRSKTLRLCENNRRLQEPAEVDEE